MPPPAGPSFLKEEGILKGFTGTNWDPSAAMTQQAAKYPASPSPGRSGSRQDPSPN